MKFSEVAAAVASNGGKFLKIQEGANVVRIVSEPIQLWKVYAGKDTQAILNKNAPKPAEAKMLFAMYVIDRSNGEVKIAEFGRLTMKQIIDFSKSPDYGFEELPPYDITVFKEGKGTETTYKVIPARMNSQLTAEETAKVLSQPSLEDAYKAS